MKNLFKTVVCCSRDWCLKGQTLTLYKIHATAGKLTQTLMSSHAKTSVEGNKRKSGVNLYHWSSVLKVGSCPNNDKSAQCLFLSFSLKRLNNFIFQIHSRRKKRKSLLRIRHFSFVYFLCVEIPILKIVLSHAHM